MTARIVSLPLEGRMGALEMQQFLERYLSIGLLVSVAVHAMLISAWYLGSALTEGEVPVIQKNEYFIDLGRVPPPSIERILPRIKEPAPVVAPPVATVPKPVQFEVPSDAPAIPNQRELEDILNAPLDTGLLEGLGDGSALVTDIPEEEGIPGPEVFIPHSQEPVLKRMVQPNYPDIARQAALEGTVTVQFYVNQKGIVEEVRVARANPVGLGFEEEAVKAVRQWAYIPALQGDQPVGVWVSQVIRFKVSK